MTRHFILLGKLIMKISADKALVSI